MSTRAESSSGVPGIALTVLVWLWVLVPFGYGLFQLVTKIPALFGS